MNTLLNDYNGERWTPVFIDTIRNSIIIDMNYAIEKNIAYNMQYLQYISKQLSDLKLTSVVKKMLIKSYIIKGMSILEAIFYCLLKEKNLIPTDYWKTEKKYISNEIGSEDNRTRIVSEIQKKYDPKEAKMNLDSLIAKIKKHKIFATKILSSDILEWYRKLRNKIHIYICEDSSESDYNSFNEIDYVAMKFILKELLSSDVVTSPKKREYLDIIFGDSKLAFMKAIKKDA